MEYIVTCCSHEHLLQTLELDIDGFVIGERFLSLNLPYTYRTKELPQVIAHIVAAGKKVYVDMRTLIPNEMLDRVQSLLRLLEGSAVTGVLFADPAIYMEARDLAITYPLIWGGDTISTNWYMNDFWASRGVSHTLIAKELTKEAIQSIDGNIQTEDLVFELQGFGPLTMFHSRRNLLDNYFMHLKRIEVDRKDASDELYLFDAERNNYYPITEDLTGTHIFSPKDICLIDEFDFLNKLKHFRYLKLDAKGHDEKFMNEIFRIFLEARALYLTDKEAYKKTRQQWVKAIAALYDNDMRTIDKGFLYKPTIY